MKKLLILLLLFSGCVTVHPDVDVTERQIHGEEHAIIEVEGWLYHSPVDLGELAISAAKGEERIVVGSISVNQPFLMGFGVPSGPGTVLIAESCEHDGNLFHCFYELPKTEIYLLDKRPKFIMVDREGRTIATGILETNSLYKFLSE